MPTKSLEPKTKAAGSGGEGSSEAIASNSESAVRALALWSVASKKRSPRSDRRFRLGVISTPRYSLRKGKACMASTCSTIRFLENVVQDNDADGGNSIGIEFIDDNRIENNLTSNHTAGAGAWGLFASGSHNLISGNSANDNTTEGINTVVKPLGSGYGGLGVIQWIPHRVYVDEDDFEQATEIIRSVRIEPDSEPGPEDSER